MKTETYQEYLARGGKVTVCAPAGQRRRKRTPSEPKEVQPLQTRELEVLPQSLKIALGLRK